MYHAGVSIVNILLVSAVCFILLVCCWQREDDWWQTQSWDCDALL